jgi:hypothetical protein
MRDAEASKSCLCVSDSSASSAISCLHQLVTPRKWNREYCAGGSISVVRPETC